MLLVYTKTITPRLRYTFKHVLTRILGIPIDFTTKIETFIAHNEVKMSYVKQPLGDEFSLLHLSNTITDSGKTYAGYNVSPYTVKVTQVSEQSSKAIATDEHLLGNIQLADLAVRY